MKRKDKVITILGLSVLLCSVFLVAMPAIAAEQNQAMQKTSASTVTTASEDDFVLGIYGNANEDDTIDMRDLTYVKLIFFGKKPETELADAKYDGKINPLDFIQIKLIIVGKEKEITFVDARGEAVTVKKPVERIVILHITPSAAIRVLGEEEKVVGSSSIGREKKNPLYPVMSELPLIGRGDYEAILNLKPDIALQTGTSQGELEEKLNPWVTVVRFEWYKPEIIAKQIMELGYILDKEDEAKEFADFQSSVLNTVKARTEGLSEDERPRVFYCAYPSMPQYRYYAICPKGYVGEVLELAGGNNIAADLPGAPGVLVDPEWVLVQNPDIIFGREGIRSMGYLTDDITWVTETREQMVNEPGWDHIKAVKDGKVYIEVWEIDCGIQSFIMVAYMAKLLYPELFEDFDPEAIHQEFLTRFLRVDYDLDEHGTFVYPPIIKGKGKLAGIPDRYYDSIVAQP